MHVNESASNANLSPELPELSTLGTVRTRELRAGDQEDIVSGTQAYDADQVEAATGIRAPAMAELRVGKESLLILSLTSIERGQDGFRRLRVDGEEIQVDVDHIVVQTSLWNRNQTQTVDGEPLRRGAVIVHRAPNTNSTQVRRQDQLGSSTRLLELSDSPLRHFSVLSVGNNVRVRVNDGVARNVQIRDLADPRPVDPVVVAPIRLSDKTAMPPASDEAHSGDTDLSEPAGAVVSSGAVQQESEMVTAVNRVTGEADAMPAEATGMTTIEEDRVVVEHLQTLALENGDEFLQSIRRLANDGQGEFIINHLSDFAIVGVPMARMVAELASNQQNVRLILSNFEQLTAHGIDAVTLLEALGDEGEQYFSELEDAVNFLTVNAYLLYDTEARKILTSWGLYIELPSDERFFMYGDLGEIVVGTRGGGKLTYHHWPEPKSKTAERKVGEVDPIRAAQLFSVPNSTHWRPTSTTNREAAIRLEAAERHDAVLRAIVGKFAAGNSYRDIVAMFRENAEFRTMLGSYFLTKIGELAQVRNSIVPDRVRSNDPKNMKDVVMGYPVQQALSQEYVAMLALAMLDGSYKQGKSSTQIRIDAKGNVVFGQHRAAAMMLLGVWDPRKLAHVAA